MVKKFFLKLFECLLEDNGKTSLSRICTAAIVVTTLGVVVFVAIHKMEVPDLSGPTLFISGGTGSTYGLNKLGGWIDRYKNGAADPQTTLPPVAPIALSPVSAPPSLTR